MFWENLTTPQFIRAVEECRGVCVLPVAVIEKHGEHLPLGTDLFIGREIARRAAALEPAIIFPSYYFTQIFEGRHVPGTIGIGSHLMHDLLEATCDEIARNGFKKILILSSHGGNEYFLPHFIRLQVERPRDYVVYFPSDEGAHQGTYIDAEIRQAWAGLREHQCADEHAGELETSLILATSPELVDRSALPNDLGESRGRLGHLEEAGLYTAIGWYANHPEHYAGRGEHGTAEKGELVLAMAAKRLARLIRAVKDDDQALALQDEFFRRMARGSLEPSGET